MKISHIVVLGLGYQIRVNRDVDVKDILATESIPFHNESYSVWIWLTHSNSQMFSQRITGKKGRLLFFLSNAVFIELFFMSGKQREAPFQVVQPLSNNAMELTEVGGGEHYVAKVPLSAIVADTALNNTVRLKFTVLSTSETSEFSTNPD